MPKPTTHYSRLNARYLASRYAGATFMFIALGLLAGLAYRLLLQPTLYTSRTDVAVTVIPNEAVSTFDWNKKATSWRRQLHEQRDWGLLSVNLRYALKLAATEKDGLPDADLSLTLAEFEDGVFYSTSYFKNRYLQRVAPLITVKKADLARYMDFQSLAAIVADTVPPSDKKNWDFAFFNNNLPEKIGTGIIVDPDHDDMFFQVFYKLHEFIHNRPALTPHAAWRTAVDEITARIDREIAYPGGGGFGNAAKRELIREIQALPILAANGLYHVNTLFSGEDNYHDPLTLWGENWAHDASISLLHHGRGTGLATANVTLKLRTLGFPRDLPHTHIGPLATATLINFIAARERLDAHHSDETETTTTATLPAARTPEPTVNFVAELEELPVQETKPAEFPPLETATVGTVLPDDDSVASQAFTAQPALAPDSVLEPVEDPFPPVDTQSTYVEMYDEVAAKQQQSLIKMHEEAVKLANVERDAAIRQLNNARAASNRLSHEAITARNRADKLRERYDSMAAAEGAVQPKVSQETLELFKRRDELLQRLISLREYCTEEHPFVKLALRDLRAVEQMLGDQTPDASANRDAEARATRLANLYLEWETAISQADVFEERARQHDETIACMLDEITNLERCISQREIELAQAKEVQIPIVRVLVPQQPVYLPPAESVPLPPEPAVAVARELPEPTPPASTQADVAAVTPWLLFAKLPPAIGTTKRLPDWSALWWSALGGLATALLWMLLRELFADRFRNVSEAHRLVGLPVLASLPAYDQASVQAAADTMKGELFRTRPGRYQFMPMPVEMMEPAPEGRRGKITPARKRMRWLTWLLGLLFLLIAGILLYRALTGYILPPPRGTAQLHLSLPSATVPVWAKENAKQRNETWGNQP